MNMTRFRHPGETMAAHSLSTHGRDGMSRAAIEHILRDEPDGLTVGEISRRVGRHPNTVRGHLDVLVSRDVVTRVSDEPDGPGRPRMRYRLATSSSRVEPTELAASAVASFAAAVAEELGPSLADPAVALRAGRRWAREISPEPLAQQQSAQAAVERLVTTMRRAGFGCELSPSGDRLYLTTCPYGALVETAPAICSLHLYLAQATLAEQSDEVQVDHIDVDVEPGLCVLQLNRRDRAPRRVVTRTEKGSTR